MPKSKFFDKAFKSFISPLVAPRSSSAPPSSGRATPTPAPNTPIRSPTPTNDLVLNNLATACRITKDVAEALNQVPYIKAVTGVVAQIIKIHEEVQGNKDRRSEIISMVKEYSCTAIECLAELRAVEGEGRLEGLKAELGSFQIYLEAILKDLELLKNQSRWKAYAKRDKDIEDMRRMERELKGFVDRFTMKTVVVGVREAGAAQPKLTEIQQTILREHWLRSQHAQYNITVADASPGSIDRAYCAPDTRKPILDRVTTWARDQNPTNPAVFWMVGEGGAGKSTIARTIAMMLDEDNTFPNVITFFCSRKFSETNQQVYIIPTIAYHLAKLCPFYSSELLKDANVTDSLRVIPKQMTTLLTHPWNASFSSRPLDSPPFLVIIDALDEIVSQEESDGMSGGFAFLNNLFMAVEQGHLKGIKFFVTSRPHPELSRVCRSLPSEAICRLYDIPTNEIEQDISRYLHYRLPKLLTPADSKLLQLIAAKADGLQSNMGTTTEEQRQALQAVLGGFTLLSATSSPINSLYCQIIGDAFELRKEKALSDRLDLLHTIICTEDRISIDVLVNLVSNEGDNLENAREMVEDLLRRLHAVLWISDGCITWYHASFLDFLLSPASASIALPERTLDASCNVPSNHATLARRCFNIMRSSLKFNICQLSSSFLLDSEVVDMETRIKDHISHVLQYACRYWAIHTSKSLGPGMEEDIMRFLDENLLFWIEAMNLVQQSSLCASLLNIVQQHVIRHYPSARDIREHLSAASHFSTVFKGSPAAKSTPHLYMSTLVYTALRFPLLQRWWTRFSRLPELTTYGIGTQLLMTLNGHRRDVNAVAFFPDGSRIVSGSDDHSVRIWDVETGEEIKALNGHTGYVVSVALFSDGSRIVSGSYDYSVRIWDVETGEEIKALNGHMGYVMSVALSSDDSRIVSGSYDHSVRIWDVETGEEIKALKDHTNGVTSVAFSPDGSRIVSGSYDHSVRIWDVETGEEIKALKDHTNGVNSVAFSTDGSRIVSGSEDCSVRVWDVETGEEIKALNGHRDSVTSVSLFSDGSRIVSGSYDRSVRIWDVETGEEIKALNGHTNVVKSVALSSDGSRIVSGSYDCSVRVWDVEMGEKIKELSGHAKSVVSVAFSPDGTCIVSGSYDKSVRVWDVETGEQVKAFNGHKKDVKAVAFSPDGSRIVSGSEDCSVRVWDVETGKEIKQLNGHGGSVISVVFSPDGSRIVSGSHDSSVRIWDVETGEQINKLKGHTDWVRFVAFSSDGSRIVSGSDDRSVRVWDVETGEEIKALNGHASYVMSVALSSDGSRIVSGSYDCSVRVWDVEVGEEIKALKGHTNVVNSVAFSPDGSCIVSGSDDHSVRVWDVETGEQVNALKGHTSPVNSVAFSSDGSRIVSGSDDRSVRVWDAKMRVGIRNVQDATQVSPTPELPQLNWTVNDDGWIIQTHTSNRIMWLPDTLTAYLYRPTNTMIISQQTASLNLAKAEFGPKWMLCYTP